MAIYLVDYENVYIEGLEGIEQLTEEDTLHIFYTHNRCGLTFGLYQQLIACKAKVELNEVSVSLKNTDPVKNALDIQLMMFTGYLIGTKRTDALYIVSKDKDFLLGTNFYEQFLSDGGITLRLVPSVAASLAQPEPEQPEHELPDVSAYEAFVQSLQEQAAPEEPAPSFAQLCDRYAKLPAQEEPPAPMLRTADLFRVPTLPEPEQVQSPMFTVQYHNTVRNLLGKSTDEETVSRVCEIISDSDNLVALNNGLARYYRDGERAKVVYHKCKPKFENLRHLSKVARKG